MENGFLIAFETAWKAYKIGSTPIGASVINEKEEVVAIGQNQIQAKSNNESNIISLHQLAHAETNAILQLSEETVPNLHPNIRKYTLYAVMEPCPFCFGAIVMGSIRNIKFAARDGIAGATALNNSIDYIKNKSIKVIGPYPELEIIQIAIQSCFEIERHKHAERLLNNWSQYCPKGVAIGKTMYENGILKKMALHNEQFEKVRDYILSNV